MFESLIIVILVVLLLVAVVIDVVRWRLYKYRERQVNRHLVAYEGKLRELGHEPNRVYHDFENMLDGDIESRQASEFDTESMKEDNDAEM